MEHHSRQPAVLSASCTMFAAVCAVLATFAAPSRPVAAELLFKPRSSIWDFQLGEELAVQPDSGSFQNISCGSNGGAPRQRLKDWNDYRRCAPEASGLREIYFEYDDENEYIARARDMEREITRWAGTTEVGYPIVTSILVDQNAVVQGVRLVTDPRQSFRNDVFEPDLRPRAAAYRFGGTMAQRFGIDPPRDCVSEPLAEGEGAIAGVSVKQSCERKDEGVRRRYAVRIYYYRKVGQSGYDPRVPGRTTQGAFESSSRFEIYFAP